jgi:predicted ATP-binding protein involved in virulence
MQVEADDHLPMPLLVLFSPYREPPKGRRPTRGLQAPQTRTSGYDDAFDLWADIKHLIRWLRTYDLAAQQEGRSFESVDAAREAIIRCLPGCTDIRYMARFDEVMIKRADGSYESLWRLSDGYRTMAALVGELAWRAVTLNPVGTAGRPDQVQGVVLIDELDIHLHPSWQRRVVETLRSSFPRVQFIATTHSPFIIQSMQAEEVINLDRHPSLDNHLQHPPGFGAQS